MAASRYTHVTIQADDLAESVGFYESVFGMERLPTPAFDEPIRWLRCGDLQLHLIETDAGPPAINHHGLHVDDFEGVYRALLERDDAEFETLPHAGGSVVNGHPPVYVLPTGTVQLYVRDPAGNLVEVNAPDAAALDGSVVPNLVEREDVVPPGPGDPDPVLYGEALRAAVGLDGGG